MNKLFYILGIGLAGRISSFKKKYKGDRHMFDHTKIFINMSEYNGKFSYSASCVCNDVFAQGLGNSPFISIYSNGFKNQIETESSLEKEVRFSKQKFKETHFYLYKPIDHYEGGKLMENVWANFEYRNFKWIMINEIPQSRICKSCGKEIEQNDEVICDCGEYII